MPLLPLKTQVNATTPLYAPASGGGGGGGGGGPNLVVSTLTAQNGISSSGDITTTANLAFPTGIVGSEATVGVNIIAGYTNPIPTEGSRLLSVELDTTAGQVYGPFGVGSLELIGITSGGTVAPCRLTSDAQGGMFLIAASSIVAQCPSTINFSTSQFLVNGLPVGGGGAIPGDLTVSSLTLAGDPSALGAELQMVASDTNLYEINTVSSSVKLAGLSMGLVGGRNQVYIDTAEAPNFYTSTITGSTGVIALNPSGTEQIRIGGTGAPGDISVNTTGGGSIILNGLVSTTTTVNVGGTPALVNIAGGTNAIQLRSDNTANATMWATGASGLRLSTITSINGGEPLVMNPQATQIPAFVQSGYCQDVPYGASTILFSVPYTTDSIAVHLTATNRNTSGGANPNISLGNSYGPNGRGVSSIGFQVDTRNNGVGYDGSFFWMAMPTNQ